MKRIVTLLVMLQLGLLAGLAQQNINFEVFLPLAYQGTLSSNGVPVNVPHDVVLSLWAGPLGGTQIGVSSTNLSLPVTNGQFNALIQPWSSDDFSSTNLHVQIALRRTGSGAPYVTLSPRQRLASVPLAAVAGKALTIAPTALSYEHLGTQGVDGIIIQSATLTAEKIAPAQVVKSINGLKDGVILQATDDLELTTVGNTITLKSGPVNCQKYIDCYWGLFGNANIQAGVNFMGGVLGELDPVEFRVNNTHVMRYEVAGYVGSPSTPNIIGGSLDNAITVGRGSVISGGGYTGQPNFMENGHWDVIGGGVGNRMTNQYCVIDGGLHNHIHGSANPSAGWYSKIGGGILNKITAGTGATISGGNSNVIGADYATIGGGSNNVASGPLSSIGGGGYNRAALEYATVGGGLDNLATNVYSTIGGGARNVASGHTSTVGGGHVNTASSYFTTVSGGQMNVASTDYATVAGGRLNTSSAWAASVGGGESNTAATAHSTIPGGLRARTSSYGQQAYASGQFANPGDAQESLYVSRNITQNATPTELFLDGVAGTARMKVPVNGTWTFQTLVVARDNMGPSYNSAGWRIEGVVEHYGVATFLIGTPTVTPIGIDPGATAWTVNPGVWGSGANAGLSLTVTGGTMANPVRWVATTRTSEVVFP